MKTKIIVKSKEHLKELIEKEIATHGNECDLNHLDVSAVTDMSKWDVSNVANMEGMFYKSQFNRDISKWNVSQVENMYSMFAYSQFNSHISNWNVSNVKNMSFMFEKSEFNRDLTDWKPCNLKEKYDMFYNCSAPKPYWYPAENTQRAINSYELNEKLEIDFHSNPNKTLKVKI